MSYFYAILTALMTFISPCVLPMLPVFVSYFAAADTDSSSDSEPLNNTTATSGGVSEVASNPEGEGAITCDSGETTSTVAIKKRSFFAKKKKTLINAFGFALGVMIILMLIGVGFAALGAFFGKQFETALEDNRFYINLVSGLIVIVMGLAFIGVLKIPFLTGSRSLNVKTANMHFFSALLLGLVYALSFGSCIVTIGSFTLIDVIKDAIEYGEVFRASTIQFVYAFTFGMLFVISALIIDKLKGVFGFIKRNYKVFNLVSGCILIALGLLMATGLMDKFTGYLNSVFGGWFA